MAGRVTLNHIGEGLITQLDEEVGKAIERAAGGDAKGQVSLTLNVEWDPDEVAVVVTHTLKATEGRKGSWQVDPSQTQLDFGKLAGAGARN